MNKIIENLNMLIHDGLYALWKASGLCPAQTLRVGSSQIGRG